jgi:hypothetical protein
VIYLEKHPETKRGAAGAEARFHANEKFSFAKETAKKTGTSARIVQLHAERGEKIAADVLRSAASVPSDIWIPRSSPF